MAVLKSNIKIFFSRVIQTPNKQGGFTMIELIVTIAVFTMGLMAAFTLALSNYNTSRENENRVMAANLAREGIELVRGIRDGNWLARESNEICDEDVCRWDSGSLMETYVKVDYDDYLLGDQICSEATTLPFCVDSCLDDYTCTLYLDADGFYNHNNSGIPTKFARGIAIDKICLDGGVEHIEEGGSLLCTTGEKIGIFVRSRVQWGEESGRPLAIEIYERIYNWRQ